MKPNWCSTENQRMFQLNAHKENQFHCNMLPHPSSPKFQKPQRCKFYRLYMNIHLFNVYLWRNFAPCASKSFFFLIYPSIYCLLATTRVLFQVAQKADKVTAAGQTVRDVDSQQSETDSRRVIKVCHIYRNKTLVSSTCGANGFLTVFLLPLGRCESAW